MYGQPTTINKSPGGFSPELSVIPLTPPTRYAASDEPGLILCAQPRTLVAHPSDNAVGLGVMDGGCDIVLRVA